MQIKWWVGGRSRDTRACKLVNCVCVCDKGQSVHRPVHSSLIWASQADRARLIVWGNSVRLCKRFWQEVTDRWASVSETKSRRNPRLKQVWCCKSKCHNYHLSVTHCQTLRGNGRSTRWRSEFFNISIVRLIVVVLLFEWLILSDTVNVFGRNWWIDGCQCQKQRAGETWVIKGTRASDLHFQAPNSTIKVNHVTYDRHKRKEGFKFTFRHWVLKLKPVGGPVSIKAKDGESKH